MDNKERVINILKEIREDVDYQKCNNLIEDGILSSLEIVRLVSSLNHEFGVKIPATSILPDNFNDLDSIVKLIERIMIS